MTIVQYYGLGNIGRRDRSANHCPAGRSASYAEAVGGAIRKRWDACRLFQARESSVPYDATSPSIRTE